MLVTKLHVSTRLRFNGGTLAFAAALGCVVLIPQPALAQWADCASAPANSKQCVPSGNGNVGIGTVTPGKKLSLYGGGFSFDDNTPRAIHWGDGSVYPVGIIGDPTTGALSFNTNTSGTTFSERMRIDSKGNVGIGATGPVFYAPSSLRTYLTVKGSGGPGVFEAGSGQPDGPNTNVGQYTFIDTNITGVDNRTAILLSRSSGPTANYRGGSLEFWTRSDGPAGGSIARMSIDHLGNVGIGTTSPSSLFQVNGTASLGPGSANSAGSGFAATITGPSGKAVSSDGVNFALMSNDALASNPLTLNMGVFGSPVAASRYSYLQSSEYGTGNYRPIALNPSGGNVGIGTTSPLDALHVAGTFRIGNWGGTGNGFTFGQDGNGNLQIQYKNPTSVFANVMALGFNGNVGIGIANPQSRLAVNGTITTKEVVVTNTGWADYVFTPGYKLRPLTEVARFINENGHLPEIPSEAEVKQNGVSMGEMQAKLLAKVEELTLHAIHADERIKQLEDELRAAKAR